MIRLNNKGQSLVLFVLLLPIILFIMMLVYDMGNLYNTKKELDNVNSLVVSYGVNNSSSLSIDSLIELVNLNCDNVSDISVKIDNDKLYVSLVKKVDGLFLDIFDVSFNKIESSYVGYINEGKIERIK